MIKEIANVKNWKTTIAKKYLNMTESKINHLKISEVMYFYYFEYNMERCTRQNRGQ